MRRWNKPPPRPPAPPPPPPPKRYSFGLFECLACTHWRDISDVWKSTANDALDQTSRSQDQMIHHMKLASAQEKAFEAAIKKYAPDRFEEIRKEVASDMVRFYDAERARMVGLDADQP